jgi:predicted nucleic acid-binding Zn ribbon protein
MAMYGYKCKNEKCSEYDKEVSVSKSMNDSSREEFCEKCKEKIERVFSLGGHATFGDGYKS